MNKPLMCSLVLGCATLMYSPFAGAQTNASGNTSGTSSQGASTPGSTEPGQNGKMSGMNMGSDQDKQFVQMAALGGYTEITFSQLALQKSQNSKVKSFAQKMVTDHTALNNQMMPVAQTMGITAPTSLDSQHQQLYDQLNQLSGADFDKQYISDMDTDHHKTLDAFKSEEASTQDKQLKPLVKKGEKVIAQHTAMADKLMKSMGGTASGM